MHGISVMWVAIFVGFVLFWSGLALYWGFGLAKENQRQNDHVKRFLHRFQMPCMLADLVRPHIETRAFATRIYSMPRM